MMKLPVNINKKQSSMPVYAVVGLLMLGIALFCLFMPFIPAFADATDKNMQTVYMIIGGIGTMFFAFATAYTVFNIISPPVGITVSDEGIYEYTVAASGAGFIPKEAIVSLKTFGKDKKRYLGINVSPKYAEKLGVGIAAKREIMNNIDAGIPAVIIRENDIKISVSKLLEIIMDAYSKEEQAKEENKKHEPDIIIPRAKEPAEEKALDEEQIAIKTNTVNEEVENKPYKSDVDTIIAASKAEMEPKKLEDDTIKLPPPSVIKTVDELLAQLNIKSKSNTDITEDKQ